MYLKIFRRSSLIISVLLITLLFNSTILASDQVKIGNPIVGDPPQKVEDNFILEPDEYNIGVWIENLRIPWELVFLSENKALVTERAGQVRLIENGILQENPYKIIDEVAHIGEGGLMGLAKHPQYPEQKYLYVMHTYQDGNEIFTALPVIMIQIRQWNLTKLLWTKSPVPVFTTEAELLLDLMECYISVPVIPGNLKLPRMLAI